MQPPVTRPWSPRREARIDVLKRMLAWFEKVRGEVGEDKSVIRTCLTPGFSQIGGGRRVFSGIAQEVLVHGSTNRYEFSANATAIVFLAISRFCHEGVSLKATALCIRFFNWVDCCSACVLQTSFGFGPNLK